MYEFKKYDIRTMSFFINTIRFNGISNDFWNFELSAKIVMWRYKIIYNLY